MFCTKCGNQLRENAKFCNKCGAPARTTHTSQSGPAVAAPKPEPAVAAPKPEPAVAAPKPEPAVAAPKPQPVVATTKPEPAMAAPKPEPQTVSSEPGGEIFKFKAPKVKGEAVLGELKNKAAQATGSVSNPGQVITSGFKQFFANLLAFFKNPLTLIPTILVVLVYPAIWMVLNILQANGINPWPLKILSFLTCANGGMSGGFIGGLGGIIGKGVFIAGIVTLICSVFRKKGRNRRSFGEILKGSFGVSKNTLGVYFTGIGIALLFYLFLTGGATRISSLCGIGAMIIAASAALNNGFRSRFINSLTSKMKYSTGQAGAGLMRGFTVGYTVSAILGFISGLRIIHVIFGIQFLIAGMIFIVLQLTGVIKPKNLKTE